jgi:hypothetical protein
MSHYNEILHREIINLSVSRIWEEAKLEWELESIYFVEIEQGRTCLCTYEPICEICVLQNKLNNQQAEIGNVCVKNFVGIDSGIVFNGVRRIKKDVDKGLNPSACDLFLQKGLITQWEYGFLVDTFRKRYLSGRQADKRREINQRVLANVLKKRTRPRKPVTQSGGPSLWFPGHRKAVPHA